MGLIFGSDAEEGSLEYVLNPGGNHRGESHRGVITPAHRGSWSEKRASEQNYQGEHGTDVRGHPETRSLEETFEDSPGFWGWVGAKLGYSDQETTEPGEGLEQYEDLSERAEGHHGVLDPAMRGVEGEKVNVPEVQEWIDRQLEEGNYKEVGRTLAIEEETLGRSGVLDYVDESDLRDIDLETAMEEFETYNSKEQEMPGHVR